MISAVLFDLDDTLSDRAVTARMFLTEQYRQRALTNFGMRCDQFVAAYFELEREGLLQKAKLFPILAERLNLPTKIADEIFSDFQSIYPAMAKPQANALTCLHTLQQEGLRCAVVSNGEAIVQRPKIETLGLTPLIEFALISSEVGFRKPDREIFEMAASRLGLEVNQCVFVGDNPAADVQGAENAGMHAIFFGDLADWTPDLVQPKRHCMSLKDIPVIVKDMNSQIDANLVH